MPQKGLRVRLMKTELVKISKDSNLKDALLPLAQIIKRGGLVVFPTETVYGLGGDATNPDAAKKIYEAKGRPSDNPLIIHIAEPSDAEKYAYTKDVYYELARHFMPGPLTVILKAKDSVPKNTRGGLETVAVRCPENKIARELIRLSGVPIAAPSANLSGSPSPTNAAHVIDDMNGRVDAIIDGGDSSFGLESTIVKINDDESLTLLRPGKISPDELSLLGFKVEIASAVTERLAEGERALSPGMKYKHYAPKAEFVLLFGAINAVCDFLISEENEKTAVLWYSEELELLRASSNRIGFFDFGSRKFPEEQAHLLFSMLRELDKQGFTRVYAPLPATEGIGLALYNRMIRAAAHKIIRL